VALVAESYVESGDDLEELIAAVRRDGLGAGEDCAVWDSFHNLIAAIARELTARGIPTRQGWRTWHARQVARILGRAAAREAGQAELAGPSGSQAPSGRVTEAEDNQPEEGRGIAIA
jgi:hypothetical protein